MSVAVRFHEVCIMFGDDPGARRWAMADAGQDRAEIHAATGQVLGVHDCSLEVRTGRDPGAHGPVGVGANPTLLRAVNGLNPVARGPCGGA